MPFFKKKSCVGGTFLLGAKVNSFHQEQSDLPPLCQSSCLVRSSWYMCACVQVSGGHGVLIAVLEDLSRMFIYSRLDGSILRGCMQIHEGYIYACLFVPSNLNQEFKL